MALGACTQLHRGGSAHNSSQEAALVECKARTPHALPFASTHKSIRLADHKSTPQEPRHLHARHTAMKLFRALTFTATTMLAVASSLLSSPALSCRVAAQDTPASLPNNVTVGVVIFDKTEVLDLVGPTAYLEFLPLSGKSVNIVTVSNRVGHIQPNNLVPLYAMAAYTEYDVLVIPSGPGDADVVADADFLDYIKRAVQDSTYVLSVCTGANILASTGMLDGRNATTNKAKFKKISAAHPNVNWVRQARWVVDGKYWTSSGISAGLDMGHAYMVDQVGHEAAYRVARILEIVPITDSTTDPFEFVIDLAKA